MRRIYLEGAIAICLAFAVGFGVTTSTHAQTPQTTTDPLSTALREAGSAPLEVSLTPYLWAIYLNGNTTVKGVKADVNVDFDDLVKDLDGALMLVAEARKGDFSVFLDTIYAKLSDNDSASDGGDNLRIDADVNQLVALAAGTYRVGEFRLADWQATGPLDVAVDPYVGARFTYLNLDLKGRLEEPSLGVRDTRNAGGNENWTDPVIGLRTLWDLGDQWDFVVLGDVGGTGKSQYSAQGLATIGYRFDLFGENNASLRAGYRALYQKFEDGNGDNKFEWDVTMHGPILGLGIRF